MKKLVVPVAACAALAIAACDGGKGMKLDVSAPASEAISSDELKALSEKSVFFAHQSVGWNVIDGIKDIAREKGGISPDFVQTRDPVAGPGFYHAEIGRNGDPFGKIADFEAIMRSGMGGRVDAALMKFCYVDFDERTDADAVFKAYSGAMKRLEADFPKTVFLRATVPLQSREGFAKALIKRILGRPTADGANIVRERMSACVRSECVAEGKPLFDIAAAESYASGGSRADRGVALRADFTADGGHLNEAGRKAAAARLIAALAAME